MCHFGFRVFNGATTCPSGSAHAPTIALSAAAGLVTIAPFGGRAVRNGFWLLTLGDNHQITAGLWLAIATSICRRIATICSGPCFFLVILQQFLSYQIFSHFTWYRIRRVLHTLLNVFLQE